MKEVGGGAAPACRPRSARPGSPSVPLRATILLLVGVLAQAVAAEPRQAESAPRAANEALAAERRGQSEQALEAWDRAVAAAPDDPGLRVRRGMARFTLGDNSGALEDYDRAVVLDPSSLPYLWQRGISLYYAERWDDCVVQFERHRTVNPADVENAVWHLLCVAGRDGREVARRSILPVGRDGRVPMREILALYDGSGSVAEVRAAAEAAGGGMASFHAHLYLGLWEELQGRREQARDHLERAVERAVAGAGGPGFMGDVARFHLRRLGERP